MNIVVYSKPNCVQCTQTKKVLDRLELKYVSIDVTADADAYDKIYNLGYRAVPVVIVEDEDGITTDHWSGFNPDNLNNIGETNE